MSNPLVACLIPTVPERAHLLPRAIRSWRVQTYEPRILIIALSGDLSGMKFDDPRIMAVPATPGRLLGHHRNQTCEAAVAQGAEIAVHFDDDDWSAPERVAEQVAELQSSRRDCVGYRTGLFWDEQARRAWMYSNGLKTYCLGNSLCYWLKSWQRVKFVERARGEDTTWLNEVDSLGLAAPEPRMIAGIHAGNAERYKIEQMAERSLNWRRAEEYDEFCAREMSL